MEAPAPTPRPRILGHSSMFCFLRSLARSRDSQKSPGQALVPELGVSSLMLGCQGGGRREAGYLQGSPSVATPKGATHLPWLDPLGLDMGDMGVHTPDPKEVLRVPAQAVEVKAVLPTGSQEVLGNPSEEGRGKEQPAGEASRDRGYLAWALEVEQDHLQRALGPVEDDTEAVTSDNEESERLLEGDPSLASSKAGLTPWNRLLSLYKQLQKSALVKVCSQGPCFLPKEALLQEEEEEEEEMEDENSSLQLCVPGSATLQSPLTKTFQPTDTVGFVESKLKKLLAGQQESRLWKMGSQEARKSLSPPESTLEEARVSNGQHLLPKEVDEIGNWLR
ncbi:gametogenetin-binding protein 1-like [Lepus europaeus]|uniref:gametogenetin-binding protein 1-like n=1 Tax=Lepus europaeus TaxID=9983 RepID=UPI002B45A728|nr:gametogenetin-binding protein 1-like [Lepus europaeus]